MLNWLVKKQLAKFGDRWGYDTGYVREIVDDAGVGAVMPLQKLGSFRKVPLDAYCGAEGVKPQTIRAILERDYGKCSKDALLGVELALATLARWGRAGHVSLAYAIVGAQAYPAFKYAIGHGQKCVA